MITSHIPASARCAWWQISCLARLACFWGITVGTPDVDILKIRHYNVISDFSGPTHTPWTIDLTNPNTLCTRIHTGLHTRIRVTPIYHLNFFVHLVMHFVLYVCSFACADCAQLSLTIHITQSYIQDGFIIIYLAQSHVVMQVSYWRGGGCTPWS